MKRVSKKYFRDFGYYNFGPMIYNFSLWLKNECEKEGIRKIYFMARDGYILKEAFDLIYPEYFKTYYMYASRRSITVPSLHSIDTLDDVFNIISFPKYFTLETFNKKVGLEDFDLSKFYIKHKLSTNSQISINNISDDFLLYFNDIKCLIIDNSIKENECLIKYLDSIDFYDKLAIVDIGWYGSMQKSLMRINHKIIGYYLGLDPYGSYDSNNYKGYIFDKTHDKEKCLDVYSYRAIFEFLTLAHHGSIKRFINSEDYVEMYDYEYENMEEFNISSIIQKGALDYIKNNNHGAFNFKKLSKKLLYPSYKDSYMWGNIIYVDNTQEYMAKPKSIIKYLYNIKELKKDFINSAWKIGFMKRLIKIPLPYYTFNKYLRNKYAKK